MAQDNEKQYFVGVEYTWGKQVGDEQNAESVGGVKWGYLTYDQSVALNAIVVESMKKLLDDSVDAGIAAMEDQTVVENLKNFKNK